MIVSINPKPIIGNWDRGFSLDQHVIESTYIGVDAYGHDRFDNQYSEIGKLLYQFKYRNNYNCLEHIIDTTMSFINSSFPEIRNVETVIPVPPTKNRQYQPTYEIANGIAEALNVYYCEDVLEKISDIEFKSLSSLDKDKLENSIIRKRNSARLHSVLLVDDLMKSGTTLNQCVEVLREDSNIDKIYVLAITKTKNS